MSDIFYVIDFFKPEERDMYSNEPIKYIKDRRKKPDIVCMYLEIAVVIVWLGFFVLLSLWHFAQPQKETFLDRLLDAELRKVTDFTLLDMAFYLLVFLSIFSLISLILNSIRLKRRTDRLRITFIISLFFSLAGIIFYLSI